MFTNISQRKLICYSACLVYQELAKLSSLGELEFLALSKNILMHFSIWQIVKIMKKERDTMSLLNNEKY